MKTVVENGSGLALASGVPEAQADGRVLLAGALYDMTSLALVDSVPPTLQHNWWAWVDNAWVPTGDQLVALAEAKVSKTREINAWRAAANGTTFPYLGKHIQCDLTSTIDLMGTANAIALTGSFPPGFPGAWKTLENTYIPLPTVDDFKALYEAFTQRGALNFQHAQELKAQVAAATTLEQLAEVVW